MRVEPRTVRPIISGRLLLPLQHLQPLHHQLGGAGTGRGGGRAADRSVATSGRANHGPDQPPLRHGRACANRQGSPVGGSGVVAAAQTPQKLVEVGGLQAEGAVEADQVAHKGVGIEMGLAPQIIDQAPQQRCLQLPPQ